MKRLMTLTIPALLTGALSASAAGYQDGFGGQEPEPEYVEINVDGGTLSEYITVIKESFNDLTSFMILPPAGQFQVPAVYGAISSPEVALNVIDGISMDLQYPNGNEYSTKIQWNLIDKYLVRILPVKGRIVQTLQEMEERSAAQRGTTTMIYELAELTNNGYSIEKILGTMQVGFEMSGSGSPVIRFHEPTSVLFVTCDSKQSDIVHEVLRALQAASERNDLSEERDEEARRQVEKAQAEGRALLRELTKSQDEVRDSRNKSAELGFYLRGELGKLEIERDRLEAKVRNLEEVLEMFGPLEVSFAEYAKYKEQAEKNATPE